MKSLRNNRLLVSLADLFFPRNCPVCGKPLLFYEKDICMDCLADVPFTYFWYDTHNPMADRFNETLNKKLLPGEYENYAHCISLLFYNETTPYRAIPLRLKYYYDQPLGRRFARILGERISECPAFSDIDLIIPVPLHWSRRWKRGYNQSEIIAKEISATIHAPVRTDILYRRRRTKTQTLLSVREKEANVADAFSVRKRATGYKHILLVDDTFTTGATLSSCNRALRTIFLPSTRISVATLAFVGE